MLDTTSLRKTEAPCPGCGTPMVQLPTTVGVVAGCTVCGGAWLDHLIANQMVASNLTDDVTSFMIAVNDAVEVPARPGDYRTAPPPSSRLCPVCRDPLKEFRLPDPPAALDQCHLHGTYFDALELRAIVVANAIEASQERTVEEMRASARQARLERVLHRCSGHAPRVPPLEGFWR